VDWVTWHAEYGDPSSALNRRLAIVQKHTREFLESAATSPVRVISMCAGEGRDILGVLHALGRRDVVGRLVELDPQLSATARAQTAALGLPELQVVTGDAGSSAAYEGVAPADLLLACGVFGNVSNDDIERTVRAFPALVAEGGTVIWTRHRSPPDATQLIRAWVAEIGFEETAYEPVPESMATVGVARHVGPVASLPAGQLFTFIRTDQDRPVGA